MARKNYHIHQIKHKPKIQTVSTLMVDQPFKKNRIQLPVPCLKLCRFINFKSQVDSKEFPEKQFLLQIFIFFTRYL